MFHTARTPRSIRMPATTIMNMVCGAPACAVSAAATGKKPRMSPPRSAAIICGKQIVQLKRPRYVPMFLPESALVRIVKGIASIAAHPHPMSP